MMNGAFRLGFTQEVTGFEMTTSPLPPWTAIKQSVDENIRILRLTKTALGQVLTGHRSVRETVSGPIGDWIRSTLNTLSRLYQGVGRNGQTKT